MTLANEIREFVYETYISPAREREDSQVTIRAGEVHKRMGLSSRMPAVCSALGAEKFENLYGIKLIDRKGPHLGSNMFFTFQL